MEFFPFPLLQKAKELFHQFLLQYPQSQYTTEAQFWLADSYYNLKDYERAILEFDDYIKKYPQDKKVPDALIKQGLSFFALGDMKSSKLIFEDIIKNHPRSQQAEIARRKLKQFP